MDRGTHCISVAREMTIKGILFLFDWSIFDKYDFVTAQVGGAQYSYNVINRRIRLVNCRASRYMNTELRPLAQ